MLKELVDYSKRQGLAGPGFAPKTVKWAIAMTPSGQALGPVPLGDTENKKNPGREFAVCPEASGMNAGGKSHFLVETLETVLLMCGKEENRPKFEAKHAFFVKQLRDATSICPEMGLFADLIENEEERDRLIAKLQEAKAKPTDKITAMIDGRDPPFLVEDPVWRDWWAEYRKTLGASADGADEEPKTRRSTKASSMLMRCFVTGELVEPAATHPKITELADVGASAMGASLVSFDKDATCSYGLKQSANAAMSEEAAAAYRAGLNHVLAHHGHRLAGAKVAYWFAKQVPAEADPGLVVLGGGSAADREAHAEREALTKAKNLLNSVKEGKQPDFAKNNHYYALTLSGNAGRVVVRDWMTGPFEEFLRNVVDWFDHVAIIGLSGTQLARPPKLETIVTCLLPPRKPKQKYEDWVKAIGPHRDELWQAALDRRRTIPDSVMTKSLLLLGQFFTNGELEEARDKGRRGALEIARMYSRLGLLTAYHNRQKGSVSMDSKLMCDHPKREYHCGRLMAVIAEVQRVALAKIGEDGRWTSVNAGVVQRYYAAASATPSLVFGRLLRTVQHHMGKMEGTKDKGHYVGIFNKYLGNIQGRIGDTSEDGIATFPNTLTFRQQSLFALGYYHQIAQMNADREEASRKRKQAGEYDNAEE